MFHDDVKQIEVEYKGIPAYIRHEAYENATDTVHLDLPGWIAYEFHDIVGWMWAGVGDDDVTLLRADATMLELSNEDTVSDVASRTEAWLNAETLRRFELALAECLSEHYAVA